MANIDYQTMMEMLRIQRYKDIANYDKVVTRGIDEMWKDLCNQVEGTEIDPTEIFSDELMISEEDY